MSRPIKTNVDYFPFICKEGKAMFFIDHKYGNDGYATWIRILRLLAVTNNHFLDLSNEAELMFLSSKCKLSEERLVDIITDLTKLGEFDSVLWERRIIWSHKFIESIQDAYKKRNNKCISYDDLISRLSGKSKPKRVSSSGNPERKEKKKKENKTKEAPEPPSLEEFKQYFVENGFSAELGERAYKGYIENGWKDRNDNPIKNWRTKCQQVWFREENKGKSNSRNNFKETDY